MAYVDNPTIEAKLNSILVKTFECPVCYNTMKPPVQRCVLGHNFCENCSDQITDCPICKSGKSRIVPKKKIAKSIIDKMFEFVEFPCRYHFNGCTKTVRSTTLDRHSFFCSFHTHPCPFLFKCRWQGTRYQIPAHCKRYHAEKVLFGNTGTLLLPKIGKKFKIINEVGEGEAIANSLGNNSGNGTSKIVFSERSTDDLLVLALNNMFMLQSTYSEQGHSMRFCIVFIGNFNDEKPFRYVIRLGQMNPDETRTPLLEVETFCENYLGIRPPKNLLEEGEKVEKRKFHECAILKIKELPDHVRENGKLYCSFEIFKVDDDNEAKVAA